MNNPILIIAAWITASIAMLSVLCGIGIYFTSIKLDNPCKCGGKYIYCCSCQSSFDSAFECNNCGDVYWTSFAMSRHFQEEEEK